jgi:hypothetical protein
VLVLLEVAPQAVALRVVAHPAVVLLLAVLPVVAHQEVELPVVALLEAVLRVVQFRVVALQAVLLPVLAPLVVQVLAVRFLVEPLRNQRMARALCNLKCFRRWSALRHSWVATEHRIVSHCQLINTKRGIHSIILLCYH